MVRQRMMNFAFDNSFARELPSFCVKWAPDRVPRPQLRYLNHALAEELRFDIRAAGCG